MTPTTDKKLFLLDAFALIFRAYFAFSRRPLINSKGLNVSAISGFTTTLLDLLARENPTHIAVCFDTAAPTERQETFTDYKANRQEAPEDLIIALPYIREIIKAFKIPIVEKDGFEADDVIGTLAKKAEKDGYTVYMVTPDKDYGQLVSENIFMYKPASGGKDVEIYGIPEILKKWEIDEVSQVIDILGLWGDAVDNIPGIPGIGEKTAKKLIGEYGSVEGLLENTDKLKGKQQENVINFGEQGLLSKQLATIITDVPLEISEEDLVREEPDKDKLSEIFAELEFRTLGKRILGDNFNVNTANTGQIQMFGNGSGEIKPEEDTVVPGKTIENTEHHYQLADSPAKHKQLVKDLLQQKSVCFDTETTSVDANNAELVGMSFSWTVHEGWYVPMPEDQKAAREILEVFRPFFESDNILKIAQNIKYDMIVLKWYDIDVKGPLYDTMLAHYLIEPDMRHNMDILAESYLGYTPVSIETLIGKKGKNQGSMRDVAFEDIKEYAVEDSDITLQLYQKLDPMLKEREADKLFHEVEIPLVTVLRDVEYEGVGIDIPFLENYSTLLATDIDSMSAKIFEIAGVEFNLSSPKQLGQVLFEKMGIPYEGKKTKTGQYSTNEDTLNRLANEHAIAGHILDHRELVKLKSTYVDALPKLINPKTGRIHTSFNQAVAATGRLSSADPNLQNIPIRTKRGREIRKAFIPRNEDYVLLSADYSQIELRIVADISNDEAMIEAFQKGQDIHATTASKVFGVPLEDVNPDMRRKAKEVNFGIIYGISAFGLAQRLGISRTEGKELIENYFAQYPDIKISMDHAVEFARENGYAQTILGRRRYLRDINSRNFTVRGFAERNAINAPIQGTAADMIKKAMINIHEAFSHTDFKTRMTLQVHDELVFDVPKNEVEAVRGMIEEKMKTALPMKVPIVVESGTGNNWLEAH